ncbi:hypothetical protein DAEQUDRAFT_559903 [Daedalea quercina L-15889]|uniref:Uncharacterized protein n=1 Tax=Daedalea quercina L-15889 TaxID=1314783 RepID=A0A165M0M7_9APHY|nr:hypothetical protein DAEQUDRAFT_559903 [Daedalea quercina L-15889]
MTLCGREFSVPAEQHRCECCQQLRALRECLDLIRELLNTMLRHRAAGQWSMKHCFWIRMSSLKLSCRWRS